MGAGFSSGDAEAQLDEQAAWARRMEHGMALSAQLGSQGDVHALTQAQQKALEKLAEVTAQEARKKFEAALRRSNLFKDANEELVAELFNEAAPIFVKKGETILEKGAIGQVMFVVLRGAVTAVKDESARMRKRVNKHGQTEPAAVLSQFHSMIAADADPYDGMDAFSSDSSSSDEEGDSDSSDSGPLRRNSSRPRRLTRPFTRRRRQDDATDLLQGSDEAKGPGATAGGNVQSRDDPDGVDDGPRAKPGVDIAERRRVFRSMLSLRRTMSPNKMHSSSEQQSAPSLRSLSTRGTSASRLATSHDGDDGVVAGNAFASDRAARASVQRLGTRTDVLEAMETVEDKEYGGQPPSLVLTALGSHSSRTLGSGRAFGTHCVLLNTPHSWTVSAKRNTLLLAIHSVQFQEASQRVSQRNRLRQSRKERLHWLQRFPFLSQIKAASLAQLAKTVSSRSFSPGEVVCEMDEPLEGMYVILSGTLALRERNGEEVSWFHQGDCVGRGIFMLASDKLMARCKTTALPSGLDICVSGDEYVECLFLDWQDLVRRSHYPRKTPAHVRDGKTGPETDDEDGNDDEAEMDDTGIKNGSDDADETVSDEESAEFEDDEPDSETPRLGKEAAKDLFPDGERSLVEIGAEVSEHLARDMLQSCSLFGLLDMAEISTVADQFELCVIGDEEEIVTEGDPVSNDDAVYMILHGVVELVGRVAPLPDATQKAAGLSGGALRDTDWGTSYSLRRGLSQHGLSPDSIEAATYAPPVPPGRESETVLLFDGETFGEECLELQPDGVHAVTCRARGAVVCARFSRHLLERVGVLEKLRRVHLGAFQQIVAEKRKSSVSSAGHRPVWRRLAAMSLAESFSVSDNFLLLHGLLEFESGDDGVMQARRRSLMRTIKKANLKVVSKLHETRTTNVFLALHTPTIQLCVVKGTNVERANEDGMGRFVLTEQTILSQVESPFIVKLLSAWHESPSTLVALEPALAGSLEHRLSVLPDEMRNPFGGMPFEMCRFFAGGILLGLKHLYELRIVHRDLKTVNILVDHHGYPKLADFGVSKSLQHRTSRTSTFVGSPRFMAPEQAALASGNSSGYGLGVDWWAFGCVLYKIATGVDCFSAINNQVEGYGTMARSASRQRSSVSRQRSSVRNSVRNLTAGSAGNVTGSSSRSNRSGPQPDSFDAILSTILNYGARHHSTTTSARGAEALALRRNDRCLAILGDQQLNALEATATKEWRLLSDFIAALLHPDAKLRLGANLWGPRSASHHALFREIPDSGLDALDFDALFSQDLVSPLRINRNDLIVDPKQLRRMHRQIRQERKKSVTRQVRGPSMQMIMEDAGASDDSDIDNDGPDLSPTKRLAKLQALHASAMDRNLSGVGGNSSEEDDDDYDADDHGGHGIGKRASGSGAAGMSLLVATQKMQSHSVATLQTVASEMDEIDHKEQMAAEGRLPTIEDGVRHRLESESTKLMGSSIKRKRQLREETMLANRRRAKILELKRRTQVSGSIGAAVLYRAISAEEHHQGAVSFAARQRALSDAEGAVSLI